MEIMPHEFVCLLFYTAFIGSVLESCTDSETKGSASFAIGFGLFVSLVVLVTIKLNS